MEIPKIFVSLQKRINSQIAQRSPGFALVTLSAVIPLLVTAISAVALTTFILRRKSSAQAICVNQAAMLQDQLKQPLKKLLQMNTQAQRLRVRRTQADLRLAQAVASGLPPAIAAAEAVQAAVILEQLAFHGKQLALLAEAESLRAQHQRGFRQRVASFPASAVSTPVWYPLALAVEPVPRNSLSPNYRPVSQFPQFQQQRFKFEIDLFGAFPLPERLNVRRKQTTECAVTLAERSGDWQIQVLAAKAP